MRRRAFSLLEVMVAVALLSLGLVLLLQVQARSISLAQQSREMTVATQLLRAKLLDCQADLAKKGFSVGDYNEEGNFSDDDYPNIYWECHAYKPDMPTADATDIQAGVGGLAGVAGDDAAGAVADQGGGAEMAMGFLAPILSQMSSVLGDSIREMHVIVRYGTGADMSEMTATTHLIDKSAVNNIAAMLQQQCKLPPGLGGEAAAAAPPGGTRGPRAPGAGAPPTGGKG